MSSVACCHCDKGLLKPNHLHHYKPTEIKIENGLTLCKWCGYHVLWKGYQVNRIESRAKVVEDHDWYLQEYKLSYVWKE